MASRDGAELKSPFHIGDTVTHTVFGEGVIRAAFLKLADLPE